MEGTYHIGDIADSEFVPVHLLLQPIPRILEIYSLPISDFLPTVRGDPLVMALPSALLLHLDKAFRLTAFQGARVQLNPGASIITSKLYWSSAGMPKKPT
jgi:hypothetical protein